MMIYTTDTADKVARDASPEAAIWIRGLARQRDQLREALEKIDADLEGRNFLENSSLRDTARAALKEIDNG